MDLRDAFTLERYRLAIRRQQESTRGARRALAVYAGYLTLLGLAVGILLAARDPLGLDRRAMPDVFSVMAWLVVFVGTVAAIQVIGCMVRWRTSHGAQASMDAEVPRRSPVWWLADAAYLLLILVSAIAAWQVLSDLAQDAMRTG